MQDNSETQPLLHRVTSVSTPTTVGISKDDELPKAVDEVTWQSETRVITRHSIPLIGTYLLQYLYSLVIILVCSQLSTEELAAVSLGITTTNIIGYAVFEGAATALDTLCAQAYGAGNLQLVGLHTLRFTIFIHIAAIPIAALWLLSPQYMPYLVPSNDLARNASTFMQWSVIGIPGYATFEAGKRFMQAQGNFTGGLIVLIACLPINIFCNWLLVFHFDLRIAGAALAAAITNFVRPLLLAGYALCVNRAVLQCWPSRVEWRSLWTNWKPIVNLAFPGVIMTLGEWAAFEILTFATSYVGTAALAAQTFLTTGVNVVWHIPFSCSVVTSTRLGQLIGGGYLETAKKVPRYYMPIFAVLGMLNMLLLLGFLQIVIHYLSMDEAVRLVVADALPFTLVFAFFDSVTTGVHGIVRGVGWQSMGGWVTVLANYFYGVPLALLLELGPPHLGLRGLWLAVASGLALVSVVEGLLVKSRSWDKLLDEANARQGH